MFVNTLEFTKYFHIVSLTFTKQAIQGSIIMPDEGIDIENIATYSRLHCG